MIRGIDLGLARCETCELTVRAAHDKVGVCPRCRTPVHVRSHKGNQQSIALVLAAIALYFPANALPVMHTVEFPLDRNDTILSGIIYLWQQGSWDLAVLVFAASIMVPILKLGALGYLLLMSRHHAQTHRYGRTRLYRVLEVIGHWSMLDVFVVALLTAVVQLGRFAHIEPGPGVLPFAAVVVLTMLASASFEQRSIWDDAPAQAASPAPAQEGSHV